MLIASLFVLSAVTVNGLRDNEHGPRRTKQLDLQDIRAPVKEELTAASAPLDNNPTNGYLPPVSPLSLQPTIVGAQSLQRFEFKPLNSLEKENEPCKPTSKQVSCSLKNSSSSDSKIPKPSRDLVPPFNDIEQETALPIGSNPGKDEEIKVTTQTQSKIPTTTTTTTTEKLVTASSEQVARRVTSISPGTSATTANVRAFSSRGEATNELRSYLPPQSEFSAAAQTNVAVVQPSGPNTDHDHHHDHHHGKDFDICADAFHSFLCAPLKARKRITGAFPSSLRGQSSFINYQKLLPNFERDPAPSNTFQNAYLPPKYASASSNLIQSTPSPAPTTRPPVTSTVPSRPPPKVIPEPSNSNDRFYLPPLTDNKIVPAPSSEAAFKFSPPRSTSTARPAAIISSFRTTTSTAFPNPPSSRAPLLLYSGTTRSPVLNFSSSNENRFYLPPSINPQPAPSFITAVTNIRPVTPTISPQPSVSASPSTIATSNTISTTRKPQPVFSVLTVATKLSTTERKPQSSTASIFSTPVSPFQVPTRAPPSFNSISDVAQTQKFLPTTKKPFAPFKFAGEASGEGRSYLPPDTNLAAAAQTSSAALAPQNPFHHGRDLCTDPFHSFLCVSAKPRKRITGELPSGFTGDSSNTQESRLRPESDRNENKVPLEGAPAQSLGYKYPKPTRLPALSNVIPSAAATSSAGYSYPKSDKVSSLQSQQNVELTASASSTTAKPELRPSEARVVSGYQYPKPNDSFPLPGEQSTASPSTSSPTAGYSYPKPQKPLSLPTEQKPRQRLPPPRADLASPTTQTRGYQYPKPEQSLKLPEKGAGYSYPKPAKRLELPTESRLKLQGNSNLDPLGALGSADFIPVNKLDFKRSESKLAAGLRRFGERQKKRQRETNIGRKRGE